MMDSALMLLGFTRAAGRFIDEPPADLGRAMRTLLENRDHPDPAELLRTTMESNREEEPDLDGELATVERYLALFEALNWAVSLDDRLTEEWPFEEIAFGKYWCDEFAGGDLIRGLRYVRNAVHHDWSLALDVDPEETPFQARVELLYLSWLPGLSSKRPHPDGERAFAEMLAGRSVGDTLLEINEVFEVGVKLAMGERPRQTTGPAMVKRSAADRYVPEAAE